MSEPTKEERPSKDLATKADLRAAAEAERATSWLSSFVGSAFGALATVLGVSAIVFGGVWATIDRAEAKGVQAAKDEVAVQLAPVRAEVSFNSKRIDFMVVEQRETRLDVRAFAQSRATGIPVEALLRPLAPLPTRTDGGP